LPTEAVHDHSSCRIASASIVISTTTPPLSKVLFQLTPKSWRLIVALAVKPALAFGRFPEQSPPSLYGQHHLGHLTEVPAQLRTRSDVQK
jgi:hypothetical protein